MFVTPADPDMVTVRLGICVISPVDESIEYTKIWLLGLSFLTEVFKA